MLVILFYLLIFFVTPLFLITLLLDACQYPEGENTESAKSRTLNSSKSFSCTRKELKYYGLGTYHRSWEGLSYIRLATSGIPTSHQILQILVRSTIPRRGKASYITVYGLKIYLVNNFNQ